MHKGYKTTSWKMNNSYTQHVTLIWQFLKFLFFLLKEIIRLLSMSLVIQRTKS